MDPADDHQPVTYAYSFTVSQRIGNNTLWETGYVGNRSRDLYDLGVYSDINRVPLGAMLSDPYGNADDYRPLHNYQGVRIGEHNLYANYDSLQTTLRRRQGRFTYSVAYTFSKTMGVRGVNDQGYAANPFNVRDNYGPLAMIARICSACCMSSHSRNSMEAGFSLLLQMSGKSLAFPRSAAG